MVQKGMCARTEPFALEVSGDLFGLRRSFGASIENKSPVEGGTVRGGSWWGGTGGQEDSTCFPIWQFRRAGGRPMTPKGWGAYPIP
jgi:hypothetical protein